MRNKFPFKTLCTSIISTLIIMFTFTGCSQTDQTGLAPSEVMESEIEITKTIAPTSTPVPPTEISETSHSPVPTNTPEPSAKPTSAVLQGEWTSFTTENGLADNDACSVALAPDGTVWVGYCYPNGSGLSRFDGKNWITYTTDDGLAHNDVGFDGLVVSPDGTVWIGTWGGGLNRLKYDNNAYTVTHYLMSPDNSNSLTENRVSSIQFDSTGSLYIGTANGFNYFNPATGVFTRYRQPPGSANSLANNTINDLFLDIDTPGSGHLWI